MILNDPCGLVFWLSIGKALCFIWRKLFWHHDTVSADILAYVFGHLKEMRSVSNSSECIG